MAQFWQHLEAPDVGEQTRRHTKGNDVSEGIELFAKIARGVRYSCDQAIEAVKDDRESNRQSSAIEGRVVLNRPLDALQDRVISGSDVAYRKEGWQNIHPAAWSAFCCAIVQLLRRNWRFARHQATAAVAER